MEPFSLPGKNAALTPKGKPQVGMLLEAHARTNENLRGAINRLDDVLTRVGHVRPPQPSGTSGQISAVPNGLTGLMGEQIQASEQYAQELHRLLDVLGEYL